MSFFRLNTIERAYVKQYLKTNRRLLIITMVILFLLMSNQFLPGQAITYFAQNVFYIADINSNNAFAVIYLLMFGVCGMAFLLPLYQYRFLMKRTSCDLYISLPIKRERLYHLQYLCGAILLFISTVPIFILNMFFSSKQMNYIICLIGLFIIEFLGLLLYTFYTWICVKCNTLIDAILVMSMYTLLPLCINLALRIYSTHIMDAILTAQYMLYGLTDVIWTITDFLSLPWLMRSMIIVMQSIIGVVGNEVTLSGYMYVGCICAVITWSVVSIMLYCLGKRSFVKRKGEASEQRTRTTLTYPILVPAITICFLLMSGISRNATLWILLIFLVYVGLDFLTKRRIKLSFHLILRYFCLVAVIGGIQALLIHTEVFGMVHEVLNVEDIISVSLDYQNVLYNDSVPGNLTYDKDEHYFSPLITENTLIESILQDQKQVASWEKNESYEIYISFIFEMKDHNIVSRMYALDREQSEASVEALTKRWIADGILIKEDDGV